MAAEFETIGSQFVDFYFKTFDESRANLGPLYRENSMLTFEAQPVLGAPAIVEKLQNLPFQQVVHRKDTVDCQPTDDGILVLVTGALQVEGQTNPMSFTQTFHLRKDGSGTWFVFNDLFRLVYPAS